MSNVCNISGKDDGKGRFRRMSDEVYDFNNCSNCVSWADCHDNPNKKTIYCPEINLDRIEKPWLFKYEKDFNNKLLDLNGYIPPKDSEYERLDDEM